MSGTAGADLSTIGAWDEHFGESDVSPRAGQPRRYPVPLRVAVRRLQLVEDRGDGWAVERACAALAARPRSTIPPRTLTTSGSDVDRSLAPL